MKVAGIILLIVQAVSLFPALVSGEDIFANGIVNLIGRFSFAIVGIILLIIANRKKGE